MHFARHLARYSQYGYTDSGINTLKSFYNTLHDYAAATDVVGAQQGFPISMVPIVEQLNFSNGTGAKLIAGSMSWDGYTSQLQGAVDGVISMRQAIGMDTSDVVDWWANNAMQQLPALGLAQNSTNVFTPAANTVKEDLGSVLDAIPLWVKVGGGAVLGIIILAQITPIVGPIMSFFKSKPKQRHALAGHRRLHR